MARCYLARRGFGFYPVDEAGQKLLNRTKPGEWISVEAKKPRNVQHHRKLWALLTTVSDNIDGTTPEQLLQWLKVRTGYVDVVGINGVAVQVARSIAFDALDQTEFELVYDRFVAAILTDLLPGVERRDLEDEVLRMVA
jgi:hypothetical protein